MNAKELADYWQDLAKKAGLSEDQTKRISEGLGDETVAKVFVDGFRSAPEFSKGLDKERSAFEKKLADEQKRAQQLNEWYEKEAKPAYEANLEGINTLKQYVELYGPLDPNASPADKKQEAPVNAVTKEELEEMLRQRDQATVGLTKTAMRISSDYAHRFKEPMTDEQLDELEKTAVENHLPLSKAYEIWISPRVNELKEKALEERFKKEKEEAVRDALSQHNLPVDNKPPAHHPFFNPSKVEGEPSQNDLHSRSRQSFMDEWAKASGD